MDTSEYCFEVYTLADENPTYMGIPNYSTDGSDHIYDNPDSGKQLIKKRVK